MSRVLLAWTERKNETFISVFATTAERSPITVIAEAPMAESSMAAKKPPCTTPAGFKNRSSTRACHTVRPGFRLIHAGHPEGQITVRGNLQRHVARLLVSETDKRFRY